MEKIIELTRSESQIINGGDADTWKASGRFFRAVVNLIIGIGVFFEDVADAYTSTPEGQAAQQALRDFQ